MSDLRVTPADVQAARQLGRSPLAVARIRASIAAKAERVVATPPDHPSFRCEPPELPPKEAAP